MYREKAEKMKIEAAAKKSGSGDYGEVADETFDKKPAPKRAVKKKPKRVVKQRLTPTSNLTRIIDEMKIKGTNDRGLFTMCINGYKYVIGVRAYGGTDFNIHQTLNSNGGGVVCYDDKEE